MPEWEAYIEIERPLQVVWNVLADFETYKEWNPYMTVIRGGAFEGSAVEIRITTSNEPERMETGKVTTLDTEECLRIQSVALHRFVYNHDHRIELETVGQKTTGVRNTKRYGGLLGFLVGSDRTEAELRRMNYALREQVLGRPAEDV